MLKLFANTNCSMLLFGPISTTTKTDEYATNKLFSRLKVDDPVGCIGTHAVAGIWGMIAVALFVEEDELEGLSDARGLFKGGSVKLLGVQLLACVVIAAWSAMTTWLQLFLINKILPIRLTREQEIIGKIIFPSSTRLE